MHVFICQFVSASSSMCCCFHAEITASTNQNEGQSSGRCFPHPSSTKVGVHVTFEGSDITPIMSAYRFNFSSKDHAGAFAFLIHASSPRCLAGRRTPALCPGCASRPLSGITRNVASCLASRCKRKVLCSPLRTPCWLSYTPMKRQSPFLRKVPFF